MRQKAPSTNDAGNIAQTCVKNLTQTLFHVQSQFKWIKDLDINSEFINYMEENRKRILCDVESRSMFSDSMQANGNKD